MKFSKYKLGELLRVTRGASLPGTGYADEGRYLRLTLANFHEEGGFKDFKSTQGKYFVEAFDNRFLMHKGDLITPLTEQSPGLLGSVAFIPCDDLYIQSQDVGLITCNSEKLDKTFAYYLFLTRSVREQISARSQQTKIRHTSPDKIADVEVYLPDLPTQLRIAGVLGSIDEKIELNRKKIAELEALAGVVYNQLVATNQCEYSTISAVATVKTGKQDSNFSTADGEYRFFTCSKDILWCDKYEFEGKAILLTGNGDLHVRYFDGKFNAYQRTYVLQPNDARLFMSIFFSVLSMLISLARSASGSIVKFITKGDVEHIKVPAFKEQHQKLLNDCLSNVLNIEQEIDALIRIRDKLLPLLMNGQVAVK